MGGDQTIAGRQIDSGLPLGGTDLTFDTLGQLYGGNIHSMTSSVVIVVLSLCQSSQPPIFG
ncbi:hypothetical protein D3C84_1070750 [compost metagenome]